MSETRNEGAMIINFHDWKEAKRLESGFTIDTVPDAIQAIIASKSHDGRNSSAAVVFSSDYVLVRTPFGMGRFTWEEWRRG